MVVRKAGSEFQVNQTTTGNQRKPSIGADAKGNFVISWDSEFFDGDGQGVVARQFKANGKATSNEIPINTYTTRSQRNAEIGVDARGNFVVTWVSDVGNVDQEIAARRFAADGNYLDLADILPVNTYTTKRQSSTQVAMTGEGDFVITWDSEEQDGSKRGIYAQRFNADGVRQGDEIAVNTTTEGDQSSPRIAIHENGSFIITWTGENESRTNVYAQRFNANGKPQGQEFQINDRNQGYKDLNDIATTADGNFIVTWHGDSQSKDETYDIFAQIFKPNGTPLTRELVVNSFQSGDQENSAVAVDRQGNFVIAWESNGQSRDETYDVYARRFDANGKPVGREFRLNTFSKNDQHSPSIAMQPQGDFVVTWLSDGQDGDGLGIFAQRFELASTIAFDKRNIKVKEGKNAVLTLSRSDETHLRSRVTVDVIGGTATRGEDYRFNKPLNVTFKPGQTEQTIRIPILKDSLIEKKETILLEIQEGSRAYLDKSTKAKITILDTTPKNNRRQSFDSILGSDRTQMVVGEDAVRRAQKGDSRPFENSAIATGTLDTKGTERLNLFESTSTASYGIGQELAFQDISHYLEPSMNQNLIASGGDRLGTAGLS
jgi:hypothetical protein